MSFLANLLRGTIARRKPGSYAAYRLARGVVAAYENRNVEISENGERWFQQQLAARGIVCALDVGANKGEWASGILELAPQARLICYEPVPDTFDLLQAGIGDSSAELVNAALSDSAGTLEIHVVPGRSELASAHAKHGHGSAMKTLVLECKTGDQEVERLGLSEITVLKVDAEGHDLAVLQGFSKLLSGGKIRFIQFEYNHAALLAGKSLADFFELLGKKYLICRLLPEGLEAMAYHPSLDNYAQSNWIAVRSDLITRELAGSLNIGTARGLPGDLLAKQSPDMQAMLGGKA